MAISDKFWDNLWEVDVWWQSAKKKWNYIYTHIDTQITYIETMQTWKPQFQKLTDFPDPVFK